MSELGAQPDEAALQARLEAALAEAKAAWPQVKLDADLFVRALAKRVDRSEPAVVAIDSLHTSDVYLAEACLQHDRAALSAMSDGLINEVCGSLRRLEVTTTHTDDMAQVLRQRMFVESNPPMLSTYSGQGPLLHWLRAIAVREGLKLRQRDERRNVVENQALAETAPVANLELEIIRKLHGDEFRAAFEVAFRQLSPRARNLLRMHVLDGLSIDQIGAFYRTHRTTAFRWLEAARDDLSQGIRNTLGAKLGVGSRELDSMLGLIRSQLDVSLRTLLPFSTDV